MAAFKIHSNDGSSVLYTYENLESAVIKVTESGLKILDSRDNVLGEWSYTGSAKYLGLATAPNATKALYEINWSGAHSEIDGYSEGEDIDLYAVEEGTRVRYNGRTIATLAYGKNAVIRCKGEEMLDDIRVEAGVDGNGGDYEGGTGSGDGGSGDGESIAGTVTIATEEAMNALLETGTVGAVYKYVGPAGTYENGAYYVLEESV